MSAGNLASSTHIKKLRFIENLYVHADAQYGQGSLDAALGTLNDQQLALIMESWFISLRNRSSNGNNEIRWQTGLSFVTSVVTWLAKSEASSKLAGIECRLRQLSIIYKQFRVTNNSSTERIRSLPASTVEMLYTMLDPSSEQNPFKREQTRWRVYIAFVLMLHQGLRRGELLLLSADAVQSAFDHRSNQMRHWINIRENKYEASSDDPRYSKPGIKTKNSVRQLPVNWRQHLSQRKE